MNSNNSQESDADQCYLRYQELMKYWEEKKAQNEEREKIEQANAERKKAQDEEDKKTTDNSKK